MARSHEMQIAAHRLHSLQRIGFFPDRTFCWQPFNKTPRTICAANGHYDSLNLEFLGDKYLPRTNYLPMEDRAEYRRRIPIVPWSETESVVLPLE